MPCYLCETCGTQYAETATPPAHCPVCEDERQYVGWQGQRWTTHDELARRLHACASATTTACSAIASTRSFAIPQRALLLPTDAGNILWECISLVTPEAVHALKAARRRRSHRHLAPALLRVDGRVERRARRRADPAARGRSRMGAAAVAGRSSSGMATCCALSDTRHADPLRRPLPRQHRAALERRPAPGGALFPGDALQVAGDRRHVSFMYSYPNYIPMKPGDVRAMRERLAPYAFDDVYGYTWGRNIIGKARAAVDRSFDRYLTAVAAVAA